MAHSLRARTLAILLLAGTATAPLWVSMVACRGGEARPVTPLPSATASETLPSASSSAAATALPPASPASPRPIDTAVPTAPAPTSTVATPKSEGDGAWVSCHRSTKAPTKDVARDVAAMAAACAKATKMKKVGKTLTGKQAAEDAPQTFPFDAKANHCYRAYAQAQDTIQDLDVVLKDSAGVPVGQDSTDDPSPVVLEDGAVCFQKDDRGTLVVSVGMGKGSYAVEIWSD